MNENNGQCLTWRKSSRSNGEQECVELAATPEGVAARDSKNPHGGHILVSREDFRRFTETLKNL
ncbi:hypothetical protein GCM10022254_23580 [Actinomadura meridiana]|uniref:DUF397 domain-containing protein n=1 Tax=Actinomadura meridiana TaxID=559626 RepID=A0ABP8BXV8_9ACTN